MAKIADQKKERILIFTKGKLIRYIPESKANKIWKSINKSVRQLMEERGWKEGINPQTKLAGIEITEKRKEETEKPVEL